MLLSIEKEAGKMGLAVNKTKTTVMTWTGSEFKEGGELYITTERGRMYKFGEIENFTYLGTNIYRTPAIEREIQRRFSLGNRSVHSLSKSYMAR